MATLQSVPDSPIQVNRRNFLRRTGWVVVSAFATCQPAFGMVAGDSLETPSQMSNAAVTEPSPFDLALGKRLRTCREAKDWHQEQVGRWIGKKQSSVSDYELGKTKVTAEDIQQFRELFHLTYEQIYGEAPLPDWVHRRS